MNRGFNISIESDKQCYVIYPCVLLQVLTYREPSLDPITTHTIGSVDIDKPRDKCPENEVNNLSTISAHLRRVVTQEIRH